MIREEVAKLDVQFDRLLTRGHTDSARKSLVESIAKMIRRPFALNSDINYLVHYTSMDALLSLLGCTNEENAPFSLSIDSHQSQPLSEPLGYLRLYDSFHANDPSEGKFLFAFAPDSNPLMSKYEELWNSLKQQAHLPAYITSFRGVTDRKKIDDLVYWRTYGRDGLGCAIAIPVSCLREFTFVSQVRYGTDSIECTLNYFTELLDALLESKAAKSINSLDSRGGLFDYVLTRVSPMAYLFKSEAFKSEDEVRVVYPNIKPEDSLWCQRTRNLDSGVSFRHFTHLPELRIDQLLVSDSTILLGPAVSKRENMRYLLTQRLRRLKLAGPKVCESNIGFRR